MAVKVSRLQAPKAFEGKPPAPCLFLRVHHDPPHTVPQGWAIKMWTNCKKLSLALKIRSLLSKFLYILHSCHQRGWADHADREELFENGRTQRLKIKTPHLSWPLYLLTWITSKKPYLQIQSPWKLGHQLMDMDIRFIPTIFCLHVCSVMSDSLGPHGL